MIKFPLNGTSLKDVENHMTDLLVSKWGASVVAEKNRTVDGVQAVDIAALKPGKVKNVILYIKNGYIYSIIFNYPSSENVTGDVETIIGSLKTK